MSSENPTNPKRLRFVTAASLFDGHDASINIIRRMLQASGVEVIHLGHNRSVDEIVSAAIQEDVQGIAVSSYQGGHNEFFKFMIDMLTERDGGEIKVFAGGGGVIVREEIEALEQYGVARIYSPEEGQSLGLQGMIDDMMQRCSAKLAAPDAALPVPGEWRSLSRSLTRLEDGTVDAALLQRIRKGSESSQLPVIGITGTGGSGKSSLTDELIRRLRVDQGDRLKVAIVAIDPSRRKTGGALLGDRIRMNAIHSPNIFMRSVATRDARGDVPECIENMIAAVKLAGFDLIIIETPGIGQGDTGIVPLVDISLYVMTPEYGAASQLEKIDMLDYADLVVINKFDRRGADDAYRDVQKQVQRNRQDFATSVEEMPVYGTVASRFSDDGVTSLYHDLAERLQQHGLALQQGTLTRTDLRTSSKGQAIVPPERVRYLAEIAETVRTYRDDAEQQAQTARELQQLEQSRRMLQQADHDTAALDALLQSRREDLSDAAEKLLREWPRLQQRYSADELITSVRQQEMRASLHYTTLSGTRIPKVALPRSVDHGDILKWLMLENLPGTFPFTAGVFPLKREGEDPTRMFAGEGDPFRTNKRFKVLSEHAEAKRLSTAFDSVTLYGFDPDERPDIYGKVGNSGVSIATLDDMKVLYSGFDLCHPLTSVSMTINGPAPAILAMFLSTAIDQKVDAFTEKNGCEPSPEEMSAIEADTLERVRGTVQADILKEDQGQNTCIFSTEFALKMMADIQEYFILHQVRNFYSVSISGYHIAEAGANPISQLAFTLANGFTYVEAYLARGMKIDDFAANLSFFFSNGMEPEYTVIGRVARRIWATAMRDKYGAEERSQKLKYHIQTSGRSLHAQEMSFNDIRTTLQALIAVYDNCNSLHTNAYDEAVTTPTDESVRRALAIQLIINHEWGLAKNENPSQGSFIIEELTDLVEEAVLVEFEQLASRGGVLGAMETGYQRGKIQDESMLYEAGKHDGSLPLIGVNTYLNPESQDEKALQLARSSEAEKRSQLDRLNQFQSRHKDEAAGKLAELKLAALQDENLFEKLMQAVRYCSLGQISNALFEVGGEYRRCM
jgi:methylmalonyl-CoA mutase|tara:strand:+ start:528 stop:3752 length:3225 start_codon:yes stop_codon:yes gene_type:complete